MAVHSFADIEGEFTRRIQRIVWCTMATQNAQGRLRTRILHPIWEGSTGWIATGRTSPKAKDIAHNPYVSLSYWDPQHEQVYADCRAQWQEDLPTRQRIWELLKNTPEPMGYDPGLFWKGGPSDPDFGVLKLTPWRIELYSVPDMFAGTPAQVWRDKDG